MCVYIYIPGILPVPRVASLLARVPVDSWSNIPQVKRAGWYWCNTPSSCWAISPLVITALIQWTWVCFCVCACQIENSCWFDCNFTPLMLTMIRSASYRGLHLDQISLSVSFSKHWHQLMTVGKIITYVFLQCLPINPLPSTLKQHSNCFATSSGLFLCSNPKLCVTELKRAKSNFWLKKLLCYVRRTVQ